MRRRQMTRTGIEPDWNGQGAGGERAWHHTGTTRQWAGP